MSYLLVDFCADSVDVNWQRQAVAGLQPHNFVQNGRPLSHKIVCHNEKRGMVVVVVVPLDAHGALNSCLYAEY